LLEDGEFVDFNEVLVVVSEGFPDLPEVMLGLFHEDERLARAGPICDLDPHAVLHDPHLGCLHYVVALAVPALQHCADGVPGQTAHYPILN
jgi:hypothetical protein